METSNGVLDFNKICRLCLSEETVMATIFSEPDNHSNSVPLPLRIMACVSVEISSTDGLPSQICASCLCQVDGWYKFKDLCENADSILRKYVKNEPVQIESISHIKNMAQDIKKNFSFSHTVKEETNQMLLNQTESCTSKRKLKTVENANGEAIRQYSFPKYGTRSSSSRVSHIKEEHHGDDDDEDNEDEDEFEEEADGEDNDVFSEEVKFESTETYGCQTTENQEKQTANDFDDSLDNETLAERIREGTNSDDMDFQNEYSSDDEMALSAKKKNLMKEKPRMKARKKVQLKTEGTPDVKQARTIQTQTGADDDFTLEVFETTAENEADDTVTSVDRKKLKSRKTQTPKEKSTPKKRFRIRPAVPSSCNLCDKVYKNSEILRQHIKSHHVTGTIECPNCKLTFTSLRSLKYHEQRKHSNLEPVPCTFCGKKFLDKKYLRIHENIHSQVNQYVCQFCGRKFIMKTNLTVHISRHHTLKTNDFICQVCGKAFPFKLYLKKHFKTHTDYKPYQCNYCEAKFRENTLLRKHVNSIHLKLRPFLCHYCHKTFTRSLYLREHMESQHLGIQKKIECSRCGENFQNRNRLRQHECEGRLETFPPQRTGLSGPTPEDVMTFDIVKTKLQLSEVESLAGEDNTGKTDSIHSVKTNVYMCECNEGYHSKYHMDIHQKFKCPKVKATVSHPIELNSSDDETYVKIITDNRVKYICGCNKKFGAKKLLKKHQIMGEAEDVWMLDGSTDEEGNVVYTCECKEMFDSIESLKIHKNKGKCKEYAKIEENYEVKKDDIGRKVHSCRLCQRTFCKKNYFLQHRSDSKCKSTEKSKGEYHCRECGKSYSKKKLLKIHQRKFHVEEFKCEHCLKHFANITTLRNHKKLVHKDGFTKFACEYCAMKFLGISALAKHIRKHTNERPFECHICKKTFVVERSLKSHMDFVHSGGSKNFICDMCGMAFARKEYLLTHAHVHKKGRRFSCEFCDASFRWNAAKRKHLFVKHEGEMTLYKCKYCEKKFKLEKNCELHELEHEKSFIERV